MMPPTFITRCKESRRHDFLPRTCYWNLQAWSAQLHCSNPEGYTELRSAESNTWRRLFSLPITGHIRDVISGRRTLCTSCMFRLPCVNPKGALPSQAFSRPSFRRRTDLHIPDNHFNQILITMFSQIRHFNGRRGLKRHFPGSSVMFILLFSLQIHYLMPYQSACLWPSQTTYQTLRNTFSPPGNNQEVLHS